MIGVLKMDDKVANFGAEQVILVRDDDSKIKLQTAIGDIALVLTILESKGMEFDDVLIYDFFDGSGLGSSYRCLHLLAQEPRGDFDSRKHAVSAPLNLNLAFHRKTDRLSTGTMRRVKSEDRHQTGLLWVWTEYSDIPFSNSMSL